jgi:hypothetical protein
LPSVNESNTFVWASVHANGSSHRPHHHYGSLLSGVFYVDVPPKSGMHACVHICLCLMIYVYSESIYIWINAHIWVCEWMPVIYAFMHLKVHNIFVWQDRLSSTTREVPFRHLANRWRFDLK